MDSIKIFKNTSDKNTFLLVLIIKGEEKIWIFYDSPGLTKSSKRIGFEVGPETLSDSKELELCEEGLIEVDYSGKKKIEFTTSGIKSLLGEYVFYIPSWGLHTTKRIWVLIPPAKIS